MNQVVSEMIETLDMAVSRITAVQLEMGRRGTISSNVSIERCRQAIERGSPCIVLRFGPMFGGKTEDTLTDVLCLRKHYDKPDECVHVVKLRGDNRYRSNDEVVKAKSGIRSPAKAVSHIGEVIEAIEEGYIGKGHLIAMIEFPFMCMKFQDSQFVGFDTDAIEKFVSLVQERNIILILDGLGFWFNTEPLGAIEAMLSHADLAFYMQGWNTFNPEEFADVTLRCVRVVVGNHDDLLILDDDAIFLHNLEKSDIKKFILAYIGRLKSSFPDLSKFLIKPIAFQAGYKSIILVPSHPFIDPLVAIGGPERCMPTSFCDLQRVYAAAGIQADLAHPDTFLSQHSKIFDWSGVTFFSFKFNKKCITSIM